MHELFWNAAKQVSAVKAATDPAVGKKLLGMIDEIEQAWVVTGGPAKTRIKERRPAAEPVGARA